MKTRILPYALILIFSIQMQMQAQVRTCGTPDLPQQFETWLQNFNTPVSPGKYSSASIQSIFNIPVIVHIIHNNESVNSISATGGNNLNAAQVMDQINILNKDFNGTNADTNLIPSVFKPFLGKFQINFCLAVVNPTGGVLAEPGIDRINLVAQGWAGLPYSSAYITSTVKPASIWDPNKYFNIWVAPLSGGLLGYATFPNPGTSGLSGITGSFGTTTSDGVVILNSSFGSIGTAQSGPYNKGRTATHEVGHWMGLRHIWGDSNCGTDFCNDTPPAQTANYNCPNFPYKLGTCTGNTTGEMTMNYMDYTNDACMYMFTADQKYRAQLILTNSPMRAALITSTVCNLPSITEDIGISYVAYPTYSGSVNCSDYIDPIVSLTNYGSVPLNSAVLSFNVDGVNTQTLSWTGAAAPNTSFTVALTQISGLSFGAHIFNVTVSAPNGGVDNNLSNNNSQQQFSIINNFAFSASSGNVCLGNSIVLNANGATSYSWSTGATTSSVSLNPNTTTTYTVTGYLGLCSVPRTVTVTVQTPPVVLLNKTQVCEGLPTQIGASGASSYAWSSGENSSSISVTLYANTIYTVSGFTSIGCSSSQTFTIQVNPQPIISIVPSSPICSSCNNGSLSVNASGGSAPYTYNWTPGNIATQSALDLEIGCYTVTVTDAAGCSASDESCVVFDTGIFDLSRTESFVTLSPNPVQSELQLEFSLKGTKKIEVLDAMGRLIQQLEINGDSIQINTSAYAGGVYYVKVSSENKVEVVKLIKQ
jgi:hypothetical protein